MSGPARPDPRNVMGGPREGLFRFYVATIGLGGLGVVFGVISQAQLGTSVPRLGAACFVVCALLLVSEFRPLVTAGSRDVNGVLLSTAFVFAILLRYDLPLTLALQTLALLISDSTKRKALWRTGFNVGQYALSWTAAWAVMDVLGHQASVAHPLDLTGDDLLPALAGAATFFVVNELLVAWAISLKAGDTLWATLRPELAPELLSTGALLALAPLVALSIQAGPAFVPLLIPPLAAVYAVGSVALKSEQQTLLDALTGLANRKKLSQRVAQAVREGPVALILLDLDRFKEVNDTLGHHVGDQLLTAVARRLESSLRPGDTVARLGGDEFALLLPGADDAISVIAAERARDALADPFELGGLLVDVAASVGIAVSPEHGTDLDVLLQHADVAMYLSKESGEVELYDTSRDRNSPARLALLGELRRALEGDELELHFQPKAVLATRKVVGVEALVRWRHPERGLVPPEEFVPLAERSGLMTPLTAWVVDAALRQLSQWRARGWELSLAVNITVKDLCGDELVDRVAEGLAMYGVPAAALQLEVTEGSLFTDSPKARQTLRRLQALGVALSIDDFGTGWSSLAQLRSLPVSEIKVDRSFVGRMDSDPRDLAIVSSVIDLARGLGMRVVAEGVEDLATWHRLAALGCDLAQGWWLSRPLPGEELGRWLEQQLTSSPDDKLLAAPA
ncbi:MAG: GGDEF-domain containing protein [Frankiales bacterium]|nr:GGDEF-domain containing protein [Frankiales bacterium]